jgi:hypothetical protein
MLHEYHVILAFVIICCNHSRSWNVLPVDTGALLYMELYVCVPIRLQGLALQNRDNFFTSSDHRFVPQVVFRRQP